MKERKDRYFAARRKLAPGMVHHGRARHLHSRGPGLRPQVVEHRRAHRGRRPDHGRRLRLPVVPRSARDRRDREAARASAVAAGGARVGRSLSAVPCPCSRPSRSSLAPQHDHRIDAARATGRRESGNDRQGRCRIARREAEGPFVPGPHAVQVASQVGRAVHTERGADGRRRRLPGQAQRARRIERLHAERRRGSCVCRSRGPTAPPSTRRCRRRRHRRGAARDRRPRPRATRRLESGPRPSRRDPRGPTRLAAPRRGSRDSTACRNGPASCAAVDADERTIKAPSVCGLWVKSK